MFQDRGSNCAPAGARWDVAHRLVGAAQPGFQSQRHANWASGMAVLLRPCLLRRPDVAARIEDGASCQDRRRRCSYPTTAASDNRWQLQNTATGEWCTFDRRAIFSIGLPEMSCRSVRMADDGPCIRQRTAWPRTRPRPVPLSARPRRTAQDPHPVSEGDRPAAAYLDHANRIEPLTRVSRGED